MVPDFRNKNENMVLNLEIVLYHFVYLWLIYIVIGNWQLQVSGQIFYELGWRCDIHIFILFQFHESELADEPDQFPGTVFAFERLELQEPEQEHG